MNTIGIGTTAAALALALVTGGGAQAAVVTHSFKASLPTANLGLDVPEFLFTISYDPDALTPTFSSSALFTQNTYEVQGRLFKDGAEAVLEKTRLFLQKRASNDFVGFIFELDDLTPGSTPFIAGNCFVDGQADGIAFTSGGSPSCIDVNRLAFTLSAPADAMLATIALGASLDGLSAATGVTARLDHYGFVTQNPEFRATSFGSADFDYLGVTGQQGPISPVSAVPLPAGMPLLLAGIAALGLARRRR